jgi:hypothetical protein
VTARKRVARVEVVRLEEFRVELDGALESRLGFSVARRD